jgi:hypothetical protein
MSQYPPPGVAPIPVQPLEYTLPVNPGRPGTITAIGIVSIIIASLSLLGGLGSALWSFSMLMISTATARIPVAPPAPPPPAIISSTNPSSSAPSVRVTSNGFDDADRAIALDAMESVRPLSDARHKQMDKLLAKCGKQMFPVGNPRDLEKAVHNAINDSGQSYSSNGNGPDYYVLAGGRVEVRDERALFDPLDGSEKVRVADDEPDEEGNALSVAEVDALVKKAQQLAKQKLTPPQIATFTRELQDPNQALITATGNPGKSTPQLVNVMVQTDGSALFQTRTGFVNVAANGGLLFSSSSAARWAAGGRGPPFKVNGAAATLALVDAIGGLLLAILLLIAGILALRQSARGRGLHLIYALAKIPLVILGAIGWWWLVNDMYKSMSSTMGVPMGGAFRSMAAVSTAFAVIACIYPIALLIVLNLKSVREYYASAR